MSTELWHSTLTLDRSACEWAETGEDGAGAGVPTRIGGLATTYETYVFSGVPQFGVVQRLEPGCAEEALSGDPSIRLLFGHEGLPLAATRGAGLKVWADPEGVAFSAERPEGSQHAEEYFRAVADGRITEMSFAFTPGEVERSRFEAEGDEMAEWNGAPLIRHTRLASISDVSLVNQGRNPVTSVSAWAKEILEEEELVGLVPDLTPVLLRPRPSLCL